MASVKQRGDKFQLTVKNKLLSKPYYETFDSEVEAYRSGQLYESVLLKGKIPAEMAEPVQGSDAMLLEAIRLYTQLAPITDSDQKLLGVVLPEVALMRVSDVTISWADSYVRKLKVDKNLAPGTIRKRIGVMARVLDWYQVRDAEARGDKSPYINPLRLMPVAYSQYSRMDAPMVLGSGGKTRVDVKRDYRISPEAEARIRLALAGQKREGRERAFGIDPALTMLFDLIIDTGLRLSEAYKMRVNQVDLVRAVLKVEGSKGARGEIKPRVVPIKRELRDKLRSWCDGKTGLLFPFWDGTPEGALQTSSKLSRRFGSLFDFAQSPELTEHDMRHEATCRWFELRSPGGGWVFSDIEICRIMGWTGLDMALRYASLRGEDLSSRLI
jgi:integrase